jgi:hypothetical protein
MAEPKKDASIVRSIPVGSLNPSRYISNKTFFSDTETVSSLVEKLNNESLVGPTGVVTAQIIAKEKSGGGAFSDLFDIFFGKGKTPTATNMFYVYVDNYHSDIRDKITTENAPYLLTSVPVIGETELEVGNLIEIYIGENVSRGRFIKKVDSTVPKPQIINNTTIINNNCTVPSAQVATPPPVRRSYQPSVDSIGYVQAIYELERALLADKESKFPITIKKVTFPFNAEISADLKTSIDNMFAKAQTFNQNYINSVSKDNPNIPWVLAASERLKTAEFTNLVAPLTGPAAEAGLASVPGPIILELESEGGKTTDASGFVNKFNDLMRQDVSGSNAAQQGTPGPVSAYEMSQETENTLHINFGTTRTSTIDAIRQTERQLNTFIGNLERTAAVPPSGANNATGSAPSPTAQPVNCATDGTGQVVDGNVTAPNPPAPPPPADQNLAPVAPWKDVFVKKSPYKFNPHGILVHTSVTRNCEVAIRVLNKKKLSVHTSTDTDGKSEQHLRLNQRCVAHNALNRTFYGVETCHNIGSMLQGKSAKQPASQKQLEGVFKVVQKICEKAFSGIACKVLPANHPAYPGKFILGPLPTDEKNGKFSYPLQAPRGSIIAHCNFAGTDHGDGLGEILYIHFRLKGQSPEKAYTNLKKAYKRAREAKYKSIQFDKAYAPIYVLDATGKKVRQKNEKGKGVSGVQQNKKRAIKVIDISDLT